MTYFKTEEQKRDLAEYVSRVVSEAPPLTPEQADRIASIMQGRTYATSTATPERPEVSALREATAKLAGSRRAFAEALAGCQGCGLSEKVHGFQKNYGTGFHDFVALTPADVITVAKFHGKKIAAAERALEGVRS